jgi:hypothetical protein
VGRFKTQSSDEKGAKRGFNFALQGDVQKGIIKQFF